MKKTQNYFKILSTILVLVSISCISSNAITEKDIGACTARNAFGFCVESKTHYCFNVDSNGRCQVWYAKSKSQVENTLDTVFSIQKAWDDDIKKYQEAYKKENKLYLEEYSKEFPRIEEVYKKKSALSKELQTLQNKRSLGISIDEGKLRLVSFQESVVDYLLHQGKSSTGGLSFIEDKYVQQMKNLDAALSSGKITKEEYIEGKTVKLKELKSNYSSLMALYDKVISLSVAPEQTHAYIWVEDNYDKKGFSINNGQSLVNPQLRLPQSIENNNSIKQLKQLKNDINSSKLLNTIIGF